MTTQDLTNMLITKIGLLSVAMYTSFQGVFNLLSGDSLRAWLGLVSLVVGISVGIVTIWKTIRDERRKQVEHERKVSSKDND